jgi:4-carboxymuconolactone decarboxylase
VPDDRMTREELRRKGAAVLRRLAHGTTPARPKPLYLSSVEGMEHYTTEALWGSVWTRTELDLRLRMLVTLSVLSCLQRLAQLRTYLNSAFNIGLEAVEVREVLIQSSVFAGFPATVNSLELLREVLEIRGLEVAPTAVSEADIASLDRRGAELQRRLFGEPTRGAQTRETLGDAAHTLRTLERRFVFGELLHRPGLSLADRAACALGAAVAAALPDEQRAWADGCRRAGLTPAAVEEIVLHAAYYVGFPQATAAMRAVNAALGDTGSS